MELVDELEILRKDCLENTGGIHENGGMHFYMLIYSWSWFVQDIDIPKLFKWSLKLIFDLCHATMSNQAVFYYFTELVMHNYGFASTLLHYKHLSMLFYMCMIGILNFTCPSCQKYIPFYANKNIFDCL